MFTDLILSCLTSDTSEALYQTSLLAVKYEKNEWVSRFIYAAQQTAKIM